MKTMFVCSELKINDHVGEEYDDLLEVTDQPTTKNIDEYHNRIRGRIRKLWHEDEGSEDRQVDVYLDAASPYNAMLQNLRVIMKDAEGIEVGLPYLAEGAEDGMPWDSDGHRTTEDPEALRELEKLENRGG